MTRPTPSFSHSDGIDRTAEHYSKQWGKELDFQTFVEASPEAVMVMPGRQLGWADLFDDIRAQAAQRKIRVYDAACGFGDIARRLLAEPIPPDLDYLGVDIHDALDDIDAPPGARFLKADISNPLKGECLFDYVVCRAAMHHTPDPTKTFASLTTQLAKGGTIAISVYARKSPMREAVDDALRAAIVPMSNDDAMKVAAQFTHLGRDLQACSGSIEITEDIPFLGITAGSYPIQYFIYKYFIKCWHNKMFPSKYCDLVNFDWYHPPYAFRFDWEELQTLAYENGLDIVKHASLDSQHYMQARKSS